MMQGIQLSIADSRYAAAIREALARSCAWHVESVDRPDPSQKCVLVLDEFALARLPLPLPNPQRVVLVTREDPQDPQLLAEAWDAGIVSIVSEVDPLNTVLLAIMAAALRVTTSHEVAAASGITPSSSCRSASIAPLKRTSGSKR